MSRQRELGTVGVLLEWTGRSGWGDGRLCTSIVRGIKKEFWATGDRRTSGDKSRLGERLSGSLFLIAFDDTHLCIAIDTMREMYTVCSTI